MQQFSSLRAPRGTVHRADGEAADPGSDSMQPQRGFGAPGAGRRPRSALRSNVGRGRARGSPALVPGQCFEGSEQNTKTQNTAQPARPKHGNTKAWADLARAKYKTPIFSARCHVLKKICAQAPC